MSATTNVPGDMPVTAELIGTLPSLASRTVRASELRQPSVLFDPATPLGSASPLDAHMPLVVAAIDGSVEVIDGCKRLARITGSSGRAQDVPVPVLILEQPSPRTAALLRMTLNRGRPLHVREKVAWARWLFAHLDEKTALRVGQEAGVPGGELRHLQPLAGAPDDVISAVSSGRIDPALCRDFALMDQSDRAAILRAFDGLALSFQTQRELVTWLPETAHREGASVAGILARAELAAIIDERAGSAPQRIKSVRDALHAVRFPQYSAAMSRWTELVARVNPDAASVRITPSAAFERDRCDVSVSLRSPAQATRLFEALAKIDGQTWSALISPIDPSAAQKPF